MIRFTIDPSIIANAFATPRNEWYDFLVRFNTSNSDVYPPNPQIVICLDYPRKLMETYEQIVYSLDDYDARGWFKEWFEIVESKGALNIKSGVFEFDEIIHTEFADNNDGVRCDEIDQIIITLALMNDKIVVADICELDGYKRGSISKPDIKNYLAKKDIQIFDIAQAHSKINKMDNQSVTETAGHNQLFGMMERRFNKSELERLCFHIGFSLEELGSENMEKSSALIKIIEYCKRKNLESDLVKWCGKLHPEVTWEGIRL